MKKILLSLLVSGLSILNSNAQDIDDVSGKTYYYFDVTTKKKVKEIFHHIQEIRVKTDNHGNTTDTLIYIKNGPYTRYHENGNLECSGFYKNGQKNGTWKFYSPKGVLLKTEQWDIDQLIKTTVNKAANK